MASPAARTASITLPTAASTTAPSSARAALPKVVVRARLAARVAAEGGRVGGCLVGYGYRQDEQCDHVFGFDLHITRVCRGQAQRWEGHTRELLLQCVARGLCHDHWGCTTAWQLGTGLRQCKGAPAYAGARCEHLGHGFWVGRWFNLISDLQTQGASRSCPLSMLLQNCLPRVVQPNECEWLPNPIALSHRIALVTDGPAGCFSPSRSTQRALSHFQPFPEASNTRTSLEPS
jgi:hypothetical protein